MAGKSGTKADVKTVEVDGVEVGVNLSYIRSWNGLRQAAHAQSDELSDSEQLFEVAAYYEAAIENMDAVSAAKGGESAEDFMSFLAKAVKAATPKN